MVLEGYGGFSDVSVSIISHTFAVVFLMIMNNKIYDYV